MRLVLIRAAFINRKQRELTPAGRMEAGATPGGRGLRVALALTPEAAVPGEAATRGRMMVPGERADGVDEEDETDERTLAVSIF